MHQAGQADAVALVVVELLVTLLVELRPFLVVAESRAFAGGLRRGRRGPQFHPCPQFAADAEKCRQRGAHFRRAK